MALNPLNAECLLMLRHLAPEARDFVMIGRQWNRVDSTSARDLETRFGVTLADLADDSRGDQTHAEPLLERMGFSPVRSLDASDYEGATLLHDLNQPLPDTLKESCDVLFDGGSLEHVFDFPAAIRNCALMLRPGGWFAASTPVNNWMGHGFYQFSPELFFRLFQESQGFELRLAALVIHGVGTKARFYQLNDPATGKARLEFNPPGRSTLMLLARKLRPLDAPFSSVSQSDYATRWNQPGSPEKMPQPQAAKTGGKSSFGKLASLLPRQLASALRDRRHAAVRLRRMDGLMRVCATLQECGPA